MTTLPCKEGLTRMLIAYTYSNEPNSLIRVMSVGIHVYE